MTKARSKKSATKATKVSAAAIRQEAHAYVAHMVELGNFIHEFSQLEFTIRARISALFGTHQDEAFVLIEEVDAVKLVDALPRIATLKKLDATKVKAIDAFHAKFMAINAKRVKVVHGLWSTNMAGVWGVGRRPRKKGAVNKEWEFTKPEELRELANSCQALFQAAMGLAF